MNKVTRIFCLFALLSAAPLLAHEEHCHKLGADGKSVDLTEVKTEKDCKAKSGRWGHHHFHCHETRTDGKHVDVQDAKTEKDCTAKKGTWKDHGHDNIAG